MDTTRRSTLYAMPFAVAALISVGYGVYRFTHEPRTSWTLILILIVSVVICSPFLIHVGRTAKFPLVGVAVTMLAIRPADENPFIDVGIWSIGVLISQVFIRRNVLHSLYVTGLVSVSAVAFEAVNSSLLSLEVWPISSFLVAALVYYVVYLLGEVFRQSAVAIDNRRLFFTSISPFRVGIVILTVAATSTLISYLGSSVIPWLDGNPGTNRTPLVALVAALLFYVLAQRRRYASIGRQLNTLVEGSVQLPQASSDTLPSALKAQAALVLEADDIQIRDTTPGLNEIGVRLDIDDQTEQYLIASRRASGAPFDRQDERALAILAHVANESARAHDEVGLLEQRASTDALTGLPNYRALQEALDNANEVRAYHQGIALLFIDIDNFKDFNDNFGHRVGDHLLQIVAEQLRASAGGGDFISRVGGDEFIVILTDLVSLEQAKDAADRIVQRVSQPVILEEHHLRPVVSAGLAYSSHRELDAHTLVEDADRSMLQAKRSRRQGEPGHIGSVSVSSHRSSRTNDIIARAIHENRLVAAFQPIVSMDERKIWAFEALVRYMDPELGPISPPSLVARAKSLGLMNELTKQVITKALDASEQFRALEPSISCMTVNLELGQIGEAELGPFIREVALAHPDISLCIELNERSLRSSTQSLRRDAQSLQEAGVLIALDDYGSDDSVVGSLIHFPMNILKLDKSLISDIDDARQREVVKALQGFGDNLGHTVIVEGIETTESASIMKQLGVQNVQGYVFGKPLPLTQSLERLRKWGTQADITP